VLSGLDLKKKKNEKKKKEGTTSQLRAWGWDREAAIAYVTEPI
jgi:hypothetical protein